MAEHSRATDLQKSFFHPEDQNKTIIDPHLSSPKKTQRPFLIVPYTYEEHSLLNKKQFLKSFHDTTDEPYTFLVVNYSNPKKERYMDTNFEPIDIEKYKK